MHFIIGFAFVLLSGTVAAQQPVVESTSAQECYAPSVWAYCADENGNALPPVCSNPPNADLSTPSSCTTESSCTCEKPVPKPVVADSETIRSSEPVRSYPQPQILQWGETPQVPTREKNLKDSLQWKSSDIVPFLTAENPEDVEMINEQSGTRRQLYAPGGFSVDTPSTQQDIHPPLGNLPESANQMFNPKTGLPQNRPAPDQQQTPPSQTEVEPTYELPAPTPGS